MNLCDFVWWADGILMNSTEDVLMWCLSSCSPDINCQAGAFENSYNCYPLERRWGSNISVMNCKLLRESHLRLHLPNFIISRWIWMSQAALWTAPSCLCWQQILTVVKTICKWLCFWAPRIYLMYHGSHYNFNFASKVKHILISNSVAKYFFQDTVKWGSAGFQ